MPTASQSPGPTVVANSWLAVVLAEDGAHHRVGALAIKTGDGWRHLLNGIEGREFSTPVASADASTCVTKRLPDGGHEITLTGESEFWTASSVITVPANEAVIRRVQRYRFRRACSAAIHPGFKLNADATLRYTQPLHAHEQPLAAVPAIRSAVDWALPFPFHVWHDGKIVAIYGLDRSTSAGTLDFTPSPGGGATLRCYLPDVAQQNPGGVPHVAPGERAFAAGEEIALTEVFAAQPLATGAEPWIEAERMAAGILLRTPPHPMNPTGVAAGIVSFLQHCQLWEPDALGPGRGWFSNMWVRTQTGPAKKRGEMSGYFDFGWGEGVGVEIWMGAVRNWRRTGDRGLLRYVDEMTRNLDFFQRDTGPAGAYFDRTDGKKCGDFLMDHTPGRRIWIHSLAHTGSQLIQLHQISAGYPDATVREKWRATALSIGSFLASLQRPDGDLPDIIDDQNHEVNRKPHRITARVVTCGLWTRLGEVTGDAAWLTRATRLAAAVAPAIHRYEFVNQMLDGIASAENEYVDAEGACYALEGVVPLYVATRDPAHLALCQKAAAFAFAWSYFYDLPHAVRGVARGGQCCRMKDYPLLYPIGPAKAMEPVLTLARVTGDPFYRQMADEMAAFIGNWQMDAPGQPWHGGMVHALGQFSGQHWGPDLAGQVDTGMATANSLAALEIWLEHRNPQMNPPCRSGFTPRSPPRSRDEPAPTIRPFPDPRSPMEIKMKMPDLATTDSAIKVVRWLVTPGQPVQRGQVLLEVETDKSTMEVESIATGVFKQPLAQPGDTLLAGQALAAIEVEGVVRPPVPQTPSLEASPGATKESSITGGDTRATPGPSENQPAPKVAGGMFAKNRANANRPNP